MIDRRFVLQALTAAGLAKLPALALAERLAAVPAAEQLFAELARIEARAYSEEGIPMLLACEDLAARSTGVPAGFAPTDENEALAADTGPCRALPELEREITEYDAANLVKLLALADFEAGGGERSSPDLRCRKRHDRRPAGRQTAPARRQFPQHAGTPARRIQRQLAHCARHSRPSTKPTSTVISRAAAGTRTGRA